MLPRFKFSLISLFCVVSAISIGLAALQYWRIPMKSGKLYSGLCYAKDWEKLTASRSGGAYGDFAMRVFDVGNPADIFTGFSPAPDLWFQKEIPEFASFNYRALRVNFPTASLRTRRIDCPVGGRLEKAGFDHDVMDYIGVGGVFQQSAIGPKRYTIDGTVALTTSDPDRPTMISGYDIARAAKAHLRFTGRSPQGLMVFSRPHDDNLVHLVILDLR